MEITYKNIPKLKILNLLIKFLYLVIVVFLGILMT